MDEAVEPPPSTVRFLLRTGAVLFFSMALLLVGFTLAGLRQWGQGIPQNVDLLFAARQSGLYQAIQGLAFTGFAIGYLIAGWQLFRYRRRCVVWGRWLSLLTVLLNMALFGAVVILARSVPGFDEEGWLSHVRSELKTVWIQLVFPLVMLMNLYNPILIQWLKQSPAE